MTDFTQRNNTIMSWMLMHMAAIFKDAGCYDHEGSNSAAWRAGAASIIPIRSTAHET